MNTLTIYPLTTEPLSVAGAGTVRGRSRHDLDAADRQMAHLRTFQTEPHSKLSQRLVNECAAGLPFE